MQSQHLGKRVGSAWGRGLCLVKTPGGLEICVGALPAGSSRVQPLAPFPPIAPPSPQPEVSSGGQWGSQASPLLLEKRFWKAESSQAHLSFWSSLPPASLYSGCNSPLFWLFQVGSLFCYDAPKPDSHGGRFPGDPGADSFVGHVQSHQRPGNDLLCVVFNRGALLWFSWKVDILPTNPLLPCLPSPKGAEAPPPPPPPPQAEAGVSPCSLNPANGELESSITF